MTENETMKTISIERATRKQLFSLTRRKWDDCEVKYDSVAILSDGRKHDSGWGIITVIGIVGEKMEIAASCCDDISWDFKANPRMDCALPSRAMHFWPGLLGEHLKFTVSCDVSSLTICFGRIEGTTP